MSTIHRIVNQPDALINEPTIDVYLGEQEKGDFQIRYFNLKAWTIEELAHLENILIPRLERYSKLYFIIDKHHVEQEGTVRNYRATFDFEGSTIMVSTEDLESFMRQIQKYCPL